MINARKWYLVLVASVMGIGGIALVIGAQSYTPKVQQTAVRTVAEATTPVRVPATVDVTAPQAVSSQPASDAPREIIINRPSDSGYDSALGFKRIKVNSGQAD